MAVLGTILWAVAGYLYSVHHRENKGPGQVENGKRSLSIFACIIVGLIFIAQPWASGCDTSWGTRGSYADC